MLSTKLFNLVSLCVIILISPVMFGQSTGKIAGKVVDGVSGEVIIGANILIEGTTQGAATDIDGKFIINNVREGKYNLIVSYISYSKTQITDVSVKGNETTTLNVALQPETISVDSIVVVGEASLEYESALLNQRKKSLTISDAISREQIKKSPDFTSAEFLQRVPSITLMQGKFIYVRGVSERYSSAQLNNAPLASSEPDKKDFAFDLIPSYLVENTIVEKSYSADNPGDFAGGVVKINTIDFPSNTLFRFSYGTSFIPGSTTKSYSGYDGGSTDFLGIDDGTRDLPENFPETMQGLTPSDDSTYNLAKLFTNKWKTINSKSPLNQAFALAYGDNFSLFDQSFGLIFSANYKTEQASSDIESNQPVDGTDYLYEYSGKNYNRNVNWGLLFNLSYKISDLHKLGFKNTYTVNSDDEVIQLFGNQYDRNNYQQSTALRFVSRELYSGQISGQSYFPALSNLKTDYSVFYSESFRDEPDYRRYTYGRDLQNPEEPLRVLLSLLPNLREGGRYYSDLSEISRGAKLDLNWDFDLVKFKFGGLYDKRSRSFNSRVISIISQQTTANRFYYYAIDSVFAPGNFRRSAFSIGEYNDGTSDYNSGDENVGLYGMFELPFQLLDQNFSFVGGVRLENYNLELKTRNLENTQDVIINRHENDLLPSASLIYRITGNQNLRLSYSNTVNRPQFREIAPFSYYDFQTQVVVFGNPDLIQADITNYDIRYEIFPNIGELISGSVFYKEFKNPIEKVVVITTNNPDQTFANASFAKNYGFEIELRSSLRYLTDLLSDFTFTGNYTRIESEIEETSTTLTRETRPMQGQSPYILNLSLNYTNIQWGSSLTLLYYKYGDRLVEVGTAFEGDHIEEARSTIDFVANQEIGNHFELRFTAKNINAESIKVYEIDKLVRGFSTSPKYSISLTYKL